MRWSFLSPTVSICPSDEHLHYQTSSPVTIKDEGAAVSICGVRLSRPNRLRSLDWICREFQQCGCYARFQDEGNRQTKGKEKAFTCQGIYNNKRSLGGAARLAAAERSVQYSGAISNSEAFIGHLDKKHQEKDIVSFEYNAVMTFNPNWLQYPISCPFKLEMKAFWRRATSPKFNFMGD